LEDLINKIKTRLHLSPEAEEFLYSISQEKTLHKGEVLIRQGQVVKKTFFVTAGCLRSYCTDKNGKEHTLLFAIKDWWISDYIGYFGRKETVFNIECIKDATLYKIKRSDLQLIYDEIPKIERFFRKKIEKAFVRQEIRILANLTDTAKERYLSFLKMYPDIEKHLKNYHIASYLGITTESLSRIRKEIIKN